jgi:nitroreductase
MTQAATEVLRVIRSRRVIRAMTAQPVTRDQLDTILEAASFAPSAGNRRLHPLVVVTEPARLRVLRMVSPGMLQHPAAAIVICIDHPAARRYGFRQGTAGLYVDVGTLAATILLAAHAAGLGSGPVTSFSRAAAAHVLDVPDGWEPQLIVCLGHPADHQPTGMRSRRRRQAMTDTLWR